MLENRRIYLKFNNDLITSEFLSYNKEDHTLFALLNNTW